MDAVTVMADFTRNNRFADNQHDLEPARSEHVESACGESVEPVFEDLVADEDLLMEQILDNMNSTPIGQVLKKIASLPDVNKQKVLRVRRQLTEGRYDLNERLDLALEKVLDELDG